MGALISARRALKGLSRRVRAQNNRQHTPHSPSRQNYTAASKHTYVYMAVKTLVNNFMALLGNALRFKDHAAKT